MKAIAVYPGRRTAPTSRTYPGRPQRRSSSSPRWRQACRARTRRDRERDRDDRRFGVAGMGLYGASKAAPELLTKSWAARYKPRGVRVNTVSPGPTRTEGTPASSDMPIRVAAVLTLLPGSAN
ncbi:SDR family oxidoreductase [Nonomuraea sp. NPDC049784]|uniref:SDR family oxidoreductase n=1 Tax=Nonomuraea sp. NPDC049784 TaxID=3154361 RepID=UPI0033D975C7